MKEEIQKDGAPEALTRQLEQSHRIANQEGQLRRYEAQLKEKGLGGGERPCWVKPDGTIEYLYDVVLASNGIRMREIDTTAALKNARYCHCPPLTLRRHFPVANS